MSILLREFPDITWLKKQIETSFADRKGPASDVTLARASWPTVLLNTRVREAYRPNIKGPLSIFMNLSGKSELTVDDRLVKLESDSFFVTNADQNYSLQIEEDTETFNIHFGNTLIDDLNSGLSTGNKTVLDEYYRPENLYFHNRISFKSPKINLIIKNLHQANMDNGQYLLYEDELLSQLYLELVDDQTELIQKIGSLDNAKRSTKLELYRRVSIAADYIYSYYDQDIGLDLLSQISCLSKFHFLRAFKRVYGMTPSRYLQKVRLQKAKDWVLNTDKSLSEIAYSTGFSHLSSFSKAYCKMYNAYPSMDR